MTSRPYLLLVRWSRILKALPQGFVRKNLVPDKLCGSRVFYRVEDSKSRFKTRSIIQAYRNILQQHLATSTMVSQPEETAAIISPPETVRGMKVLDRKLFARTISIPCLKVPCKRIGTLSKTLKVSLLKMQKVKSIAELATDDPQRMSHKVFLLNPKKFKTGSEFTAEEMKMLREFDVDPEDLAYFNLEVGYENWNAAEILRAVLPAGSDGVSGYSIIGHIAHLNLKPDATDYKYLIGEVILDKNPSVKTVVNKLNTIDNTFRNFQMELLAGEDNFITRAKENGCVFEMDFSRVYWNPRLSTEHQRVVDMLTKGDVLYDVFAGVGPFAIPAAKKRVTVHANDLNPESYKGLVNNVKLNKVKADQLHAHNLDGREFIRTIIKQELATRFRGIAEEGDDDDKEGSLHCGREADSSAGVTTDTVEETTKETRQGKVAAEAKASGDASPLRNTDGISESSVGLEPPQTGHVKGSESVQPVNPILNTDDFRKLFITMNLPALALEFLDAFCGLLSDFPPHLQSNPSVLDSMPTVLCYCFSKSDDPEADARSRAESIMGHKLPADSQVRMVRNVAPNKEMLCVVFRLTPDVLFGVDGRVKDTGLHEGEETEAGDEPPSKKQRV